MAAGSTCPPARTAAPWPTPRERWKGSSGLEPRCQTRPVWPERGPRPKSPRTRWR
jgi:hypothetical protein